MNRYFVAVVGILAFVVFFVTLIVNTTQANMHGAEIKRDMLVACVENGGQWDSYRMTCTR